MLKIQQVLAKGKARAEVYGGQNTRSIDFRSQIADGKVDTARKK